MLEVVASGRTVYGVNTGFGQLAHVRVGEDALHQLQDNILRSHAAGLGAPLPPEIVRWMLLFKVCGLIRGHSGVQPETVGRLVAFFNEGLMPVVPRQGSGCQWRGSARPCACRSSAKANSWSAERMVSGSRPAAEVLAEKVESNFTWSQGRVGPHQRRR